MQGIPDHSRLGFAAEFAVCPVDGLGVFFIGERRQWLATSRQVVVVSRLIDGTRGADALIAAAAPHLSPPEVLYTLSQLSKAGVLADAPAAPPPPTDTPPTLHTRNLTVQATDAASAGALAAALAGQGVFLEPGEAGPSAPRLLLLSDYLAPEAARLIAAAEAAGTLWMPVKIAGERCYFGPSFGPDLAACPLCLAERLQANRPVEAWLAAATGRPFGASRSARIGPNGLALAEALAPQIAAALAGPGLAALAADAVVEHDPRTGAFLRHPLPRRACCPRCGVEPNPEPAPIHLRPGLPVRRRAGGYRAVPAEEVCVRLAPLVSDLTGRIASLERLDLPPAAVGRHVSAGTYLTVPRAARPGFDDFHGVCLGKGRNPAQAQASALAEAVERISAGWRDGLTARTATLTDLGDDAIAPERLWNFSTAQIEARAAWNAATPDPRRQVPDPLPPDHPIAWVRAWSLTADRWRWLPRDHCHANAPEPRYGRFNPNGHAAGGSLEEATLQAFLELVERDCTAIWWYNRLRRPWLDPHAAPDPYVRGLARGFAAQGWRCWLLDLTTDLAIPCLAAFARAESDGRWCIGFGCHFETGLAVERAMSELAQLFRADGRDGPPPWAPIADGDERFLFPEGDPGAGPPDAPTAGIATLDRLIDWCRDRVAARGMEMLVLDQTHPDIGLPVVKVVVPGLRHFWPRFGPGRLYDVPVAMGWLAAPRAEAELNPSHLFL